MMEGYEAMSIYVLAAQDPKVLEAVGIDPERRAGRMCALCPMDKDCTNGVNCDLPENEVWVPAHVAAIMKMQTSNH